MTLHGPADIIANGEKVGTVKRVYHPEGDINATRGRHFFLLDPGMMKEWFGGPLPRLDDAEEYRAVMASHVERLEGALEQIVRALDELLPRFGIEFSSRLLQGEKVFARTAPLVLEIGSGMGEATARLLLDLGRGERQVSRPYVGDQPIEALRQPERLAEPVDDDLLEWDYGEYEGRRTVDIREESPGWTLWRDGVTGGPDSLSLLPLVDPDVISAGISKVPGGKYVNRAADQIATSLIHAPAGLYWVATQPVSMVMREPRGMQVTLLDAAGAR